MYYRRLIFPKHLISTKNTKHISVKYCISSDTAKKILKNIAFD